MSMTRCEWAAADVGVFFRIGTAQPRNMLRKLLLLGLFTGLAGDPVWAAPAAEPRGLLPSVVGQWDGPNKWPVVAIHAFVLPTEKVLHYDFPGSKGWDGAWLWDPETWQFAAVPVNRPLFCSGHSFLADGRLFVTGGNGPAPPSEFRGIKDTHIFNPFDETWTRVEDMADGRWYPTNVTLADGRVVVFSGLDELTGAINTDVEVYDPGSGTGWQIVAQVNLPLYPRMHVLSSGNVFYSGPTQETGTFEIDAWSWYGIMHANYPGRWDGLSVLLPPGRDRVMIIGGRSGMVVTETAEIIDLAAPVPAWRYTQSMNSPRAHANAVILPDGKVLVVGGQSDVQEERGKGPPPSAVYEAEMFDPATETWSLMAAMQEPRVYHATAILLPDARVLVGGALGQFTTEIYSPPYLFRGPRPVIEAVPTRLPYDRSFVVWSPNAPGIESIVLMRLPSMTHSVDMDQRYVALQFSRPPDSPAALVASTPGSPNLAPPGYYMLFLVNTNGVPSVARMVQLGGIPGDCDGDGDVDLTDYGCFDGCLNGPGGGLVPSTCAAIDADGDNDVDLKDFAIFMMNFTG